MSPTASERVARVLECLLAPLVIGEMECAAQPKEEVRALGVVRPERERVLVLRRGDGDSC